MSPKYDSAGLIVYPSVSEVTGVLARGVDGYSRVFNARGRRQMNFDGRLASGFVDSFDTDTSAEYTSSDGTWIIGGGECVAPTSASQSVLSRDDFSVVDAYCEADCDKADDGGLVARYVDDNNYYLLAVRDDSAPDSNNMQLFRRVSGTFTSLNAIDFSWVRGNQHTFRLEVVGNSIRCYVDGFLIIDETDSGVSSAGSIGLRSNDEGAGDESEYQELRWDSL